MLPGVTRSRPREDKDQSVYVVEARRRIARDNEADRFDRIKFAMRCLKILDPRVTVAVYEGRFDLEIERGRDWSRGPNASWAMVRIPPHASKEHIAIALASISGVEARPWVIDTLLRAELA